MGVSPKLCLYYPLFAPPHFSFEAEGPCFHPGARENHVFWLTAYVKLIRCFMLLCRLCFLPGAPESRLPRLPWDRLPHLPAVLLLPGSLPFSNILYHVTLPSGTDTHTSYSKLCGGCNLKGTVARDPVCPYLKSNVSFSSNFSL